ncbi:hypothetical protein [Halospeciosus flavus]|uniref:Uncharacterized protein n=1 Tax=Halospeciosus flavus TaxID=3032283 RepID=A0ABD5Z1B6_9EURY|nr:hypothetical protein [Halospeciosus flavus]
MDVLEERVGESLRAICSYDESGYEIHYIREDIRETNFEERTETMTRRARDWRPLEDEGGPLGERRATLELWDESLFIHLPEDETRGLLFAVEPEVGRKLTGFVEECWTALENPSESAYIAVQ